MDNYYARDHDQGLLWNDPDIGIGWPVAEAEAILSSRDRLHPPLSRLRRYFLYGPAEREDGWEVAALPGAPKVANHEQLVSALRVKHTG